MLIILTAAFLLAATSHALAFEVLTSIAFTLLASNAVTFGLAGSSLAISAVAAAIGVGSSVGMRTDLPPRREP